MITIVSYTNASEAYIAKGLLENNGIPCWLRNDLITQTLPIGEIELQVDAADEERARRLLESVDSDTNSD